MRLNLTPRVLSNFRESIELLGHQQRIRIVGRMIKSSCIIEVCLRLVGKLLIRLTIHLKLAPINSRSQCHPQGLVILSRWVISPYRLLINRRLMRFLVGRQQRRWWCAHNIRKMNCRIFVSVVTSPFVHSVQFMGLIANMRFRLVVRQ